ncbi:MAG: bifunctional phosphopantothenoylcysteine decarboxylase/phosphopantothenate--cysteine ligase CoaBC [Phreatobacter sp.]|uniref:bifunctional phosphopantothenoylcysteine decarboxylase/phosphopantothenate--cysteine ligase CoaBC n=1 Tax=Phreatobacter sp. TaxID=1966341 RepID=UPI0027372EA4|nr:bifunctional phosphopantothenoylcysteine decarboxylase/phosphopantothenate--cysteine ligase CoaBC [Phreatobacter sp.]MDP2803538.1 bifunctional phosphopantothenoylcysteine decarboxylase/phosphopantothenate--cysteine ligase CoaBC [Phreatobacter sp.]
MLVGKRILLVIGGGIAAYKSLDLIRRLQDRGARVRAILTRAGTEFVTPLSVGSLTGDKVFQELFSLTDENDMGHIELSRDADLLVVAPATADLMAKMANGHANDLASTALLATDKRVLLAPAMNVRMWLNAATQRNLATLRADGVAVVGPNKGSMACGEFGPGRMAEVPEIIAAIEALMTDPAVGRPLTGRHVVVTSGPTREAIDPVRYISNHSSGKQGHAIARAAAMAGATVTLVTGPVALPDPVGVTTVHVESARQMQAAVEAALPADIAVFAAAVADWRVAEIAGGKIKKGAGGPPSLAFVENPDILATIARRTTGRPEVVVGFAAETDNVLAHARAKLARKGCDLIVANDVSAGTDTFGGDSNLVHIVTADAVETWERQSKDAVAEALVTLLARRIAVS